MKIDYLDLMHKAQKKMRGKKKRLERLMWKDEHTAGEERLIAFLEQSIEQDIEAINDYEDSYFYEQNEGKSWEERVMSDALRHHFIG